MRKIYSLFLIFIIVITVPVFGNDKINIKIAVLNILSRIHEENLDTVTISEMLETELLHQKYFTIVERAYLSKIIEEQKLQLSGLTDNELTRIGKLAEADKIVTGSISKIDDKYILVVKVIDTSTGVIDSIEQETADNIRGIIKSIPDIALKISQKYRGADDKIQTYKTDEIKEQQTNTAIVPSGNTGRSGKKYFPLQLSLFESLQVIPKDFIITGVACNIISGYNDGIYGIQTGILFNRAAVVFGLQAGFLDNKNEEKIYGMQLSSIINHAKGKVLGTQIGLVNFAEEVIGVQIGLLNSAKRLVGAQIGIVNFNKEGYVPFMIGINIGF